MPMWPTLGRNPIAVTLFKSLGEIGDGVRRTSRAPAGLPPVFRDLRDHGKDIDWGTEFACPVDDHWQDNDIVISRCQLRKTEQESRLSRMCKVDRYMENQNIVKEANH